MKLAATIATALLSAPASAAVKSATPAGFEIEATTIVPVPPSEAYAALVRIGAWWNPTHSYSGDGANMTLDPRPGGCFCETLPGGGVEHMRVVFAQPGTMLRLQGGLGPLQGEGVAGSLTWALKAAGGGTEITQTYVVGGHIRGGGEALAAGVDQVLSEQLERYRRHVVDQAGKPRD